MITLISFKGVFTCHHFVDARYLLKNPGHISKILLILLDFFFNRIIQQTLIKADKGVIKLHATSHVLNTILLLSNMIVAIPNQDEDWNRILAGSIFLESRHAIANGVSMGS